MARTQRPRSSATQSIGTRLIQALRQEFKLSMTEAATAMGYANATTLHKIRRGEALPDPARLANFAKRQRVLTHQTLNLHWLLTGHGPPLVSRSAEKNEPQHQATIDDDIINSLAGVSPEIKAALLTLTEAAARPVRPQR